jgi:cytidine diphosphoramidate kinase
MFPASCGKPGSPGDQSALAIGRVYWLTGLSGAGKTTLARHLTEWLCAQGRTALLLDGDELRATLNAATLLASNERMALAFCYARLCRLLALQGVDIVIATISLFREVHSWNRENLPGYMEILLDVPLAELLRRDPKGLYARSALGDASNVAGVDLAIEMPTKPDVVISFRPGQTADMAFAELLDKLRQIRTPA